MDGIKNENYYTVHGWMVNELGLSGCELSVYAIIYGYSQYGSSMYDKGNRYLVDFTKTSKSTVHRAVDQLVKKGFVVKEEKRKKGAHEVYLRAKTPDEILLELEKKHAFEVSNCNFKEGLEVSKWNYRGVKMNLSTLINKINNIKDEEEEEEDNRTGGGSINADKLDEIYSEVERIYRDAIGSSPTPAEARSLVVYTTVQGMPLEMIEEALRRAAVYKAKSPTIYAKKTLNEWIVRNIITPDDLEEARKQNRD